MGTLGFFFSSSEIRCVSLSGSKAAPEYVTKERVRIAADMDPAEVVAWLETQLQLLLDRHEPERVAYKATLGGVRTYDQVQHKYYAEALLHLVSGKRGVPVTHYFSSSLVPSKLGLPKGTDLFAHVDDVLGKHPPHWDTHTKEAVLVAWFQLEA